VDGGSFDATVDGVVDAAALADAPDVAPPAPADATVDTSDGGAVDATVDASDGGAPDANAEANDGPNGDGSADANADVSNDGSAPPSTGCATPYSPGFIDCPRPDGGVECSVRGQVCCGDGTCSEHSASGNCPVNSVSVSCDGPEDCDGGACVSGGCGTRAQCATGLAGCLGSSQCWCHSDADCAGTAFPYCYDCGVGWPVCNGYPREGGAVQSCSRPGTPPGTVACGATSCTTPGDVCCDGACAPASTTTCRYAVECDGPEDCPPTMVCCADGQQRVFCTNDCSGVPVDFYTTPPAQQPSDGVVCRTLADCPAGSIRCAAYALGGINLCYVY
jgi:hypothetical protein